MQIKTYDRTKTKKKYIYIYTKGHVKGDKTERTEEIKENQGSKAVRWPAAVIIEMHCHGQLLGLSSETAT